MQLLNILDDLLQTGRDGKPAPVGAAAEKQVKIRYAGRHSRWQNTQAPMSARKNRRASSDSVCRSQPFRSPRFYGSAAQFGKSFRREILSQPRFGKRRNTVCISSFSKPRDWDERIRRRPQTPIVPVLPLYLRLLYKTFRKIATFFVDTFRKLEYY